MKQPLYTRVRVIKSYVWDNDENGSEFTFGSVRAALENCRAEMDAGKIRWYSIEELFAFPCNENDPGGQLYYGMGFFTFREAENAEKSSVKEAY